MIKFYCDKCGKETTKICQIHKYINNTKYNLCMSCDDKYTQFYTHTFNVDIEDFMKMQDEN